MADFDLVAIQAAVQEERFEWSRHALERIAARGIRQDQVLEVLATGVAIEVYDADRPFPSALILGWTEDAPLHVVAAYDEAVNWAYIITAYRPDERHFEADWRGRRAPQ